MYCFRAHFVHFMHSSVMNDHPFLTNLSSLSSRLIPYHTMPCHPITSQYHNIINQTGEETVFKIKTTTKMSKVFDAYAKRKGLDRTAIRFVLDGENVADFQTPKMLELEDQDQIDCLLEQVGGF